MISDSDENRPSPAAETADDLESLKTDFGGLVPRLIEIRQRTEAQLRALDNDPSAVFQDEQIQ